MAAKNNKYFISYSKEGFVVESVKRGPLKLLSSFGTFEDAFYFCIKNRLTVLPPSTKEVEAWKKKGIYYAKETKLRQAS